MATNLADILGQTLTANGYTYTSVPKSDGGWDFYKAGPDGNVVSVGLQDWGNELGIPIYSGPLPTSTTPSEEIAFRLGGESSTVPSATGTGTGLTAQEIAAKLDEFNQNKKTIDQAYQSGLLSYQESLDALNQTRQSLTQQKDQGLENTSAYFSAVSPDAFQSQIGNYNQKVLDAYQGGQNTLANDQAKVDFYKQNLESNYADQNAALNTFDASTGQYGTGVNLSPVAAAPKLTAFDTGIAKLGAGQVPQWAPNYGGLSTMQAKTDPADPYNYLKK